ncbi:2-oxoacid:acceptor oxidoreductase subunit alpha [Sporomusa acidovorans]|uniref:2-oxoglutarate oxidoreductase subunit KorA n=1 Tax=Sporomusa acidovorans (strain ATCC 49682 / DSM 3132 / Mol) TaxID=1123286 RepID=A0ABZ3IXM4_SPOA4|nr:2-oxoacid:acceptor oxidoreductase subunit alpha [Sporomusa acidovorans]OZC13045.1 2-oxoglutarate oxidoreductase subunit KorA [Sporomusa acidovorans DSM 3132]SDF51258.1 2-oxoglutarate ferredoxin oxidoreductase, alpha subunit [Sporomusa acidovorans]
MGEKKKVALLMGNEAVAAGAIAAGVSFYAGYPITPATEIAEILASKLPQAGGKYIQTEDELAMMGAIVGASLGGAKSMTATSGPGFTLVQENLGYAALAEIPCVVVAVQRGGPSTGLPTLPAQGDVMQARWGTHGDHPIIVLSPSSVRETFDLTIEAVNYSEKYRTPVILLTDAAIAHLRERTELPSQDEIKIINRKKPTVPPEQYAPYKADADGVPPMANFGEGYRYFISGLIHNENGSPVLQDPKVATQLVTRLHEKITKNRDDIVKCENFMTEDAEIVIVAYGCVARSAKAAVTEARKKGIKAGVFRPITLWPSPDKELLAATKKAHSIIVTEMNLGQYNGEVSRIICDGDARAKVYSVSEIGGALIHPEKILNKITEVALNGK